MSTSPAPSLAWGDTCMRLFERYPHLGDDMPDGAVDDMVDFLVDAPLALRVLICWMVADLDMAAMGAKP